MAGGAERSARNLARAYRDLGHDSWLAVGTRRSDETGTFELPREAGRNALVRSLAALRDRYEPRIRRVRGAGRLLSAARLLAEPFRTLEKALGREDFAYPGADELLALVPKPPDVVHLHNLHGDYFDLTSLPRLSRRVPTILNVRDGWLMSGHCAFSLGCDRWKRGCGSCPDLSLFPSVRRDATGFNWRRKKAILSESRLYVATPSRWMMELVRESIVAAGALESRVVPNGVDTDVFFEGDRARARAAVGVDAGADLLLVAANGLKQNVWKDFATLRSALERLGSVRRPRPLVVVAIGENAEAERLGGVELRFVPFEQDGVRLADFYRAATLYLHAARVESFGNVLLEARACGTPVVATSIGGIPEQVRALGAAWMPSGVKSHDEAHATGALVPPGDPVAFAAAVAALLDDGALRNRLAENGKAQVDAEYTLRLQARRFLGWYEEIRERRETGEASA